MRSTLEWLKFEGLLLETDKEVNGDLEITGIKKHFDGGLPILFNIVKAYGHLRAVTIFFVNATAIPGGAAARNKRFGWSDDAERTKALAYAMTHPLAPVEVSQEEAPVQKHVITEDLDINKTL